MLRIARVNSKVERSGAEINNCKIKTLAFSTSLLSSISVGC